MALLALQGCGFDGLNQQSRQVSRILAKQLKHKTVAVFEFPNDEGCVTKLGLHINEQLSVHMAQALRKHKGVLVERRELVQVAVSRDLDMRSGDPTALARSFGRLVKADAVLVGSATEMGSEIYISIRAVDVRDGKVVAAEEIELPGSVENKQLIRARPPGPFLISPPSDRCSPRPEPGWWEVKFGS